MFPYLATSHTTTTRMLPVLTDATVTSTDVATVLACLAQSGRHIDYVEPEEMVSDSAVVEGLQNVFYLSK